jgi:1-acyl-sn-glycerol-3-phosphate acyltransferase
LTAKKWNAARDNRLGVGYVNFYFLNATDAVLPGYSTSAVSLPDMFEGGNRLMYLVEGTNRDGGSAPYPKPTGTVSAAVTDAEYWTYD